MKSSNRAGQAKVGPGAARRPMPLVPASILVPLWIVALVLQVFYNYILSKIEHITAQMEESAISLLDAIMKYKLTGGRVDK